MIKVLLFLTCSITGISTFTLSQEGDHLQELINGKEVYVQYCQSCHMEKGEGVEGLYPPLAKTSYLKNTKKIIDIILNGQLGEVTVNSKKYNTDMPAQSYLTDGQIADVLTYVRNSWGNKYPAITPVQVKGQRK